LSLVEFLWCPPLIECSKSPPKSTSHVRHSEQFSGSRVALEYFWESQVATWKLEQAFWREDLRRYFRNRNCFQWISSNLVFHKKAVKNSENNQWSCAESTDLIFKASKNISR
jgi:hypothetical protein